MPEPAVSPRAPPAATKSVHGEAVTDETSSQSPEPATPDHRAWSRRKLLTYGLGGAAAVVVAGIAGVELVSHGCSLGSSLSISSMEHAP